MTHQSAIKLLQQSVGVVRLVVKRSQIDIPPPFNGEEVDAEEQQQQQQPKGGESKANDSQLKDDMVLQGDWTQVSILFITFL